MIIQEDLYLQHYGTKGMRWGVRKATSSTGMTNRQLNKQSKAKDKAARQERILKTREKYAKTTAFTAKGAKAARAEARVQKQEYKKDKKEIGSREARKILGDKRAKLKLDFAIAQQPTNRKEAAANIIWASLGAPMPVVNFNALERSERVFGGK